MPTPSTSQWPRPKSEDEWEDMVLDAMRIFWNDSNAYRYGRKGQRQNGIDIIGKKDSRIVAAQAKNCISLSKRIIDSEIKKTKKLFTPIDELYFVISGSRDNKLQELIHKISIENKTKEGFEIFILFFEDVIQYLTNNQELVKKYWQSFFDSVSQIFKTSILTDDDAVFAIINLKEYQQIEKQINEASNGKVFLSLRIEHVPNLEAEPGSTERFWEIAIAENHETHRVTLWRFAINVDNGEIYFISIAECKWISREEWNEKGLI
ncbi:hypothetical protein INQ51_11585 [Maribellus sp. CM-23]|uniref:hypothetical protein n=1 Tax=Maribellus sp. CM-23 TaxID=2781026 RepID=UPI001F488777|nr:hypothetical protein [Maribellus sp. CM-23]MCE4564952.1 hypothetical protein [Maribellus sp. CM-23]